MASPFDSQYNDVRAKVVYYANQYGIPENIAIWQIWQESSFNPRSCSGRGACGIAQFTVDTATQFGVDRNDIDSSLDGWGQYMTWLLRQPYINGNISLALAGYNAGPGNVQKYKDIPPFTETENYVRTILANAANAGNQIINAEPLNNLLNGNSGNTDTIIIIAAAALLAIILTRG